MVTIISRTQKSDFWVAKKFGEKTYHLHWGKEDEVEREYVMNEETGEHEFTGKETETDWCTYEGCIYRGFLTPYFLDREVMSIAQRQASLNEYDEMYIVMGVSEEQRIELLKNKLKDAILRYDSSSHVNSFLIGGQDIWIDKATRVGLKLRFEAEQRLGRTETALWQEGKHFTLTLTGNVTALDMLDGIELYASACYDNTQRHLSVVESLDSVEAIKAYDYTEGYPQKLVFKV